MLEVIGKSKKYNIFPIILLNIVITFIGFIIVFILMYKGENDTFYMFYAIIGGFLLNGWGWFELVAAILLNKKSIKEDAIIINGDKIILNDVTGKIIEEDLKNIKKVIKHKEIDNVLYTTFLRYNHKVSKKLQKNSKIGELVFVFENKRVSVQRVMNIEDVEKIINDKIGI